MPSDIEPMKATLCTDAFDSKDWIFEIKHDGFRIIAYIDKNKIKLQTLKLNDYTTKFPPVSHELKKVKHSAILDGEVVVLNGEDISDFEALMKWKANSGILVYYYVFDLLWLNGKDYMTMPLVSRKRALKSILPRSNIIKFNSDIRGFGKAAFKMAQEKGLEGIVAKRRNSVYRPGTRSKDWLKIKVMKESDFLVCGYTRNEGTESLFSTLILGAYKEKELQFVGEVGTGFTKQIMKVIMAQIKPVKRSPFASEPKLTYRWRKKKPEVIAWCQPKIACRVKYLERTQAGELRHSSFLNLRLDKLAAKVQIDQAPEK